MMIRWRTVVREDASPVEDAVSASGPAVPLPRLHLSLATPGVALARAAAQREPSGVKYFAQEGPVDLDPRHALSDSASLSLA